MEATTKKRQSKKHALIWQHPILLTAGVDEVGRGPLAGPVIAAAVILSPDKLIPGLADSKLLTEKQRDALFPLIQQQAFTWAIGRAEVEEIERINIFQASLLAMQRAVLALSVAPEHVLVDGTHCPELSCSTKAIIKGDQKIAAISAASVLAKVIRDREMQELDDQYPGYGFATHKGYGTAKHLAALQRLGPCPQHRRSFRGVLQVSEKLSALGTEKFLEEGAKRGTRKKFLKVLKNSPNIEPEDFDKI